MSNQAWVDVAEIECAARKRLHDGHASRRALSDGYELVGLIGEIAFARAYRQPLDLDRKPAGDGGMDFTVPLRFTVDVKTFRKPVHLIHEQGKVTSDIYVLAEYSEADLPDAVLLGWEWGRNLAKAPVRDFGYGVLNHHIHRSALRPMDEFGSRVMRLD